MNSPPIQAEHGVNDRDDEEETIEEVAQTKEIDLENLKPGVKLLKMKVAKWKENDHYAILGLQDLRFHATTRQIRQVQRALSLKYHPDKLGESIKISSKVITRDLRISDFYPCIPSYNKHTFQDVRQQRKMKKRLQ